MIIVTKGFVANHTDRLFTIVNVLFDHPARGALCYHPDLRAASLKRMMNTSCTGCGAGVCPRDGAANRLSFAEANYTPPVHVQM